MGDHEKVIRQARQRSGTLICVCSDALPGAAQRTMLGIAVNIGMHVQLQPSAASEAKFLFTRIYRVQLAQRPGGSLFRSLRLEIP